MHSKEQTNLSETWPKIPKIQTHSVLKKKDKDVRKIKETELIHKEGE
jgi:hypothetical protein